jgi:hypothetical protein
MTKSTYKGVSYYEAEGQTEAYDLGKTTIDILNDNKDRLLSNGNETVIFNGYSESGYYCKSIKMSNAIVYSPIEKNIKSVLYAKDEFLSSDNYDSENDYAMALQSYLIERKKQIVARGGYAKIGLSFYMESMTLDSDIVDEIVHMNDSLLM